MGSISKSWMTSVVVISLVALATPVQAQGQGNARGPIGPSPYDVVTGWHQPFAAHGFAFGGNSGVWAESPDRIIIAQRGETRLPSPIPEGFEQHAEILCKIVKEGKKFYEVPINYNGRTKEEGKKIKFYHVFSVIYQIIIRRIL